MYKKILKNEFVQVEYLTNSLRITGLTPAGETNFLAGLRDLSTIQTQFGDFHFCGGHRRWHAPDTGEVRITDLSDGVALETQTEPGAGIRKRLEICLAANRPSAR